MDWKNIGKKLLFPPIWLMIILTVASAAFLILIFVKGLEQSIPAYLVYGLAFYTLTVLCLFFCLVLPKQYRQIRETIYAHPLANRYLTDKAFRTKVSLYLALGINLMYVGINLLSWYWSRSWWFVVLAVYYVIMAVMRFLMVRYVRKHEIGSSILGEWKRSRICAFILLLVNLSLSGAVLMILYQSKGFDYPGIMIYVMALYTFYSAIHAIVEIVKHRSLASPVMSTAKIISLSAALVSMLNLETAMFSQFGKDLAVEHQHIFIILTGAGVSLTVITLSLLLIIKATKEIRRKTYEP